VADDAQLRVALAGEVGEPDVALGIVRLESHVGGHFKRGFQRLLRAGAERSAFGRLVRFLEAGDADERLDVFDHRLPIFLEIRVDLPGQFFVLHRCLPTLDTRATTPGRESRSHASPRRQLSLL